MTSQSNKYFLEVECRQVNHDGELICGDVFLSQKIKEDGRTIVVLSDGMGSGVKANVLATLTASMAMSFTTEHREVQRAAEIIMDTLPECSIRKMSYSTFSIIDIEDDGTTTIVEYDNPTCLIMRGNLAYDPKWEMLFLESEKSKGKRLRVCRFKAKKEDRVLFWSDGIIQSGMGSNAFPNGWGQKQVNAYVAQNISHHPFISSNKLAQKVVNTALLNDENRAKDDLSCGVIYFREPRKLLLATGPPFNEKDDAAFASKVNCFEGKKIISGGTTAELVARELHLEFNQKKELLQTDLPPISSVEGIDFVTEGILTLDRVANLLASYRSSDVLSNGAAGQIVKLILASDQINVLNGTRINMAHQDPHFPMEIELKKTVVKRIVQLLEERFLKEVNVEYM